NKTPAKPGPAMPTLRMGSILSAELTVETTMTGGVMPEPVMDLGPQSLQSFNLEGPLREARDEFEKAYFEYHLAKESGSMTRVAEKTGLERTHLYRKLKQLGVDLARSKRSAL
ncbi:MAG: sigma-54-dependent Fis family transcriptional regulator, partial [Comamonadaceae bacterium]